MNGKIIAGIVVLLVGVVLVAVLCGLGGYAKQTIHDTVLTRLEYELPKGYEKDPNFEQCYRSTVTSFDEEYYLWNLTNKDEVINGGRPHFNLVGPFPYTEWYCEYDHKVNDTHLTYRRYSEGYRFIRKDPGPNDDVLITNFNPAYLVLLQSLGGQDSILSSALVGPALKSIISTFNANVGRVWINAVPQVLSQVNSVISIGYAANFFTTIFSVSAETFFTAGYSSSIGGLQGWTSYANQNFPSVDTTLTNASRDAIYGAWTNVALYQVFALSSVQDIVGNYSVTAGQAGVLKAYSAQYLPSSTTVQSNVAGQWANGDSASLLTGWEIGIPTRTDIATADVFQLFSQTGTCSLVNTTTFTASWVPALTAQNPALATCDGLSLTVTQKARILAYISSFSTAVVSVQLKKLWQLADWSDFGHAQWGHLVAGQSLGPSAGLTYIPEIAGQSVANSSCVTYTTADAQALTSGPYSLYNSTNIGIFSTLLASSNLATIKALWPVLTDTKISCLASYLNTIVLGQAVSSALATAKAAGGDYITTRTARQWLFDATDPLLVLLQQNTTTVPLVTQNSTLVQSKANATLTYVSVYTGKNDLYDALMPLNNGASMAGWCGDVRVTGFNGSQFLPYGYLDKPEEFNEHPLNLYHRLVSRPIPFENKGNDEWNGVKVRYLSLRADALTSGSINAANSVYCAQYSGAINKTGISPNLPLFLTTPNFLSADKEFYENIDFTDSIYADTYDGDTNPLSRHRLSLFILAEPTLGSSVWGNLPIQANFKFGPSALYPNIKSAYAPIFWNAIGDIATENDLDDIKTSLYANQRAWKVLIGVGVGAGVAFMVAGIVLIHHFKKHENELKEIPMGSSSG